MPLNLYGYKTFGINFEFFVWFCIPLNLHGYKTSVGLVIVHPYFCIPLNLHGYKTVGIYDNLVIGFVYLLIYMVTKHQ